MYHTLLPPHKNTSLIDIIEEWKPIKGYNNSFMVSSFGRVKSIARIVIRSDGLARSVKGKILTQYIDRYGYPYVRLSKGYGQEAANRTVHVMVAESFLFKPSDKYQVNHKKGIKTDNRVHELEWNTCKENTDHAYKTGLRNGMKGINHPLSKLTDKEVMIIYKTREKNSFISSLYNISRKTVADIKSGKTWSHITGQKSKYERSESSKKLFRDDILYIFNSTLPQSVLAEKYHVSLSCITKIKSGIRCSAVTGKTYDKTKPPIWNSKPKEPKNSC